VLYELKKYLGIILGDYYERKADEMVFYCPFHKHHHKKLEVNVRTGLWHCWICHRKGRSIIQLLRKLKVDNKTLQEVKKLTKTNEYVDATKQKSKQVISLPKNFNSLTKESDGIYYMRSMRYLESRGISYSDIIKYNLGYCYQGEYAEMIVIPNYDKRGLLNYYSARAFVQNKYEKHKNPIVDKNIVGFEYFLNWEEPLFIVEGAMDAITLKHNASPSYGSSLSKNLLIEIYNELVNDIYICLDPDAMRHILKYAEYFLSNGFGTYLVEIPKGEDINSLGYEETMKLVRGTELLDDSMLFEYKLKYELND